MKSVGHQGKDGFPSGVTVGNSAYSMQYRR